MMEYLLGAVRMKHLQNNWRYGAEQSVFTGQQLIIPSVKDLVLQDYGTDFHEVSSFLEES